MLASPINAWGDSLSHISPDHRKVVKDWLDDKPHLRVAVKDDCCNEHPVESACKSCEQEFNIYQDLLKGKNYHPYYVTRDINGDKIEDFAICFIDERKSKESELTLAIFNGPFDDNGIKKPDYINSELWALNRGFSPTSKHEIHYCQFGTDACLRLVSKNGKYVSKGIHE